MGVAREAASALAQSRCHLATLIFFVFLLLSSTPSALGQLEDAIVFNVDSTYIVQEEQPAGSAAVMLQAYYILASPLQSRADGEFALDQTQPDSQLFYIESAVSEDGSRTVGTLRNSVVMDRDAEGAQTVFSVDVIYSTPDGSLSQRNTVRKRASRSGDALHITTDLTCGCEIESGRGS